MNQLGALHLWLPWGDQQSAALAGSGATAIGAMDYSTLLAQMQEVPTPWPQPVELAQARGTDREFCDQYCRNRAKESKLAPTLWYWRCMLGCLSIANIPGGEQALAGGWPEWATTVVLVLVGLLVLGFGLWALLGPGGR